MGENTILDRFLNAELNPETFDHRAHLAVGWAALGRFPPDMAERRVCDGLRALANGAGVPEKFNKTLTIAFLRLIAARARGGSFDRFLAANGDLLTRPKDVLARHYISDRLYSSAARAAWLPPDLEPLPETS